MTKQPEWEQVYATDYSALYRDKTGVYPPELVVAQTVDDADEDDIEATAAVVFRFPLERCWRVTETDEDDGTMTTYITNMDPAREPELPKPLSSYKPWYLDSLGDVARSSGMPIADLTDALCSDDPRTLANAFEAIGGHHGYDNFDQYPEEWTASEFEEWPERGVKLSTSERDEFTKGYISCALWCGVMVYEHDDCPCHEASENGDAYDADSCECNPEMNSSSDEHDESELTSDALKQLTDDAHEFYAEHAADLRASTLDMERCGHDFWLTRNRHGAGFWDDKGRGSEADAALDRLTKASHPYGEMNLVQGADMKVGVL
ncbi:MAG TPA: hypothetical protein VIU64_17485 [Polyangia bacterium]